LSVDVLTSGPEPGFFEEDFSDNVTIYKVGVHKKSLHFWRRVEVIEWLLKARGHYRRLVGGGGYDLAHAFFGFPTGYLCRGTARELPYVISLRGSDVPGANVRLKLDYMVLGPVFKRIWSGAAALVACSDGLRERALKFRPGIRIEVIPNGVDSERFACGEGGERSGSLRLLTVGRLSATKRVEMLIDAVEILRRDNVEVHLSVAGSGSLEGELRERIAGKGLGDFIEMMGRLEAEEMPGVYRASDILVSATMQEGMSNAMLEAMASGLPIITTRCEGAEELISDNGIVVERAEAGAIADAVRRLGEDRQRYEQMAVAGRARAERFSWKSVADEYVGCYNTVIESHSGHGV